MGLHSTLGHLRDAEELLAINGVGIEIASEYNRGDLCAYLQGKRGTLLWNQLGLLRSRQKNLMLSASIFRWIAFSTERDQNEFDRITSKCAELQKELQELEDSTLEMVTKVDDHDMRGQIYLSLGTLYSAKLFSDKIGLMVLGHRRSSIGNIYAVRRFHLDELLCYRRKDRKRIREDRNQCILCLKKAISEFDSSGNRAAMGYAWYNLAVNLKVDFRFRFAGSCLGQAERSAEDTNDAYLLSLIPILREALADRNRNIPNYVEEFGLDLPS